MPRVVAVAVIRRSASELVMVRCLSSTTRWEQSVIWLWFQEWGRSSARIAASVITRNFHGWRP